MKYKTIKDNEKILKATKRSSHDLEARISTSLCTSVKTEDKAMHICFLRIVYAEEKNKVERLYLAHILASYIFS